MARTLSQGSTDATEIDRVETHEKATGLILKTISPNLRIELKNDGSLISAQSYWDHLKKKFEKQDGVSSLLNFTALVEMKLVDDGTLEAQLNVLESIQS